MVCLCSRLLLCPDVLVRTHYFTMLGPQGMMQEKKCLLYWKVFIKFRYEKRSK